MLNFIRQTLTSCKGPPANCQDDGKRTMIAAGVILLEAAHADNECTEDELLHVIDTLRTDFELSEKHAGELIDLAHRKRSRAVDLFEFSNHINNEFSREEKQTVLEAVWRIIYIDGQLEKHEDHFVRKLTHLLRLTHKDMINAKLKALEQVR